MPGSEAAAGRFRRALSALLVFSCAFCVATPAGAREAFRMGVNRVNFAWVQQDEQERILNEIAASGVSDVRLSLKRPVERSIRALAIANRLGLKILLEVQLADTRYYPPDRRKRTGHDRIWDVHRLSDLDLDLYRKKLRKALRKIDELGISLVAVEPGNEINLSSYNGDLLVYKEPGRSTPRGVGDLRDPAAFERGLDAYIGALKITREELRATTHSRDATLISAGLTDMSADFADMKGFERLDAAEVIGMLRARGLDNLVDAYGIHIYPGNGSADAIESRMESVLEFCQPSDAGKPCWITEWGIGNEDQTCPIDDRAREKAVRAVRRTFEELAEAERLDAAYYYDWDTNARYGLWRCGGITPAGALAIGVEQPS